MRGFGVEVCALCLWQQPAATTEVLLRGLRLPVLLFSSSFEAVACGAEWVVAGLRAMHIDCVLRWEGEVSADASAALARLFR